MATTQAKSTDVEKYLSGVSFPVDKQTLIQQAKSKGASGDVVSALNGLPNKEYMNSADVLAELDFGLEDES
jgi:hypothetical protein